MWKLSRPKPALPSCYFWTWDHSTNWVLDDPGVLNTGCYNKYLKRPETFVGDYARLTDLCEGIGIKGIAIWGFIRDAHGGIENSKRVADYAASKGVAIMPGFGTTWYGGAYYEGDHPYNLETFVQKNPDVKMISEKGEGLARGACPSNPAYLEWLQESIQWLFDEFAIGGANLENGDFLVCNEELCKEQLRKWPQDHPSFLTQQALSYVPAFKFIGDRLGNTLVTAATYCGFVPGAAPEGITNCTAYRMCEGDIYPPVELPKDAVVQWTLTGMVLQRPLPLTAYLDDGAPDAAFDNPFWPRDLKCPGGRAVGFAHQGSQWTHIGRYDQMVSTVKECCLRAYRSGLEGVVIHGEASARMIPNALNYLAFSHFSHWPEDTIRDFGIKTLGQVLESEEDGERFAEILAHWDAGSLTESQKQDAGNRARELYGRVAMGDGLEPWRFWDWLNRMANGWTEKHTITQF